MLKDWMLEQFPIKTFTYRGKEFQFYTDAPNGYMEEINEKYADGALQGVNQIRVMLRILSIEPKITEEDMAVMPEQMLRELWELLFPKKAAAASPSETIANTSSAQ